MKEEEIKEGDIVEIDYIVEFTKEHINEGKALVIWKGRYHQPLVRKLDTKTTVWTCYEHIAKVVGHIGIEGYMDKVLEPKTGHWIKYGIPRCEEQHYQCTNCDYYINFGKWGELYSKEFKYCPNCGIRMERE